MTAPSFTSKQLRVTLILASPNTTFPGTNSNKLVLTNLRVSATIVAVARQPVSADVRIYGMSAADMGALTILWFQSPGIPNNVLIVEANSGNSWVQIFEGVITEGQPDYTNAPEVFFHVQAATAYFSQVSSTAPISFTGPTDIVPVLKSLATKMGYGFQNNGVTATLANPYYSLSVFDQFRDICNDINADFYFIGNTLNICPADQPRLNSPQVVLSPTSGLIGYPVISRFGIIVTCLFNPAIDGGGKIQVQSSILPNSGTWNPYKLTHTLESWLPGGKWQSVLECTRVVAP